MRMARGADVRGHLLVPDHRLSGLGQFSRHAETGLFSTIVADGSRHVDERLLAEFESQRELFASRRADARARRLAR